MQKFLKNIKTRKTTSMLFYYVIFAVALTASLASGLQNKTVQTKKTVRSELGKYLRSHVFKRTTQAADPQHCLADCWDENDRCQSFNFLVDLNMCELNEASNLTNPDDLIDKPRMVYLTNPAFGRQPKPQMARHTNFITTDPCASYPCTNAESCVKDVQLGYRCQNCHSNYHGPRCEEHVDPCFLNSCEHGGTCISTMTSWRCVCPFPLYGRICTGVRRSYYFYLNGTADYPYVWINTRPYSKFTLNFLFKTNEQNTSYFLYYTPDQLSDTNRLAVWRVRKTFFVELWKDYVYNFTFPLSYPLNDNHWHFVTIVLHSNAMLSFYLDGVVRETPKLTNGIPGTYLYHLKAGKIHIGYFKDSNDQEYFYNGSIGNVDLGQLEIDYNYINGLIVQRCVTNHKAGLEHAIWKGLLHLARPVDCLARVPVMGIHRYQFFGNTKSQWLEQTVSPARNLTSFTMVFQIRSAAFPPNPSQLACYGDQGDNCSLSVTINPNMTLEIIIELTRLHLDLIPIIDNYQHFVILTWTNNAGVLKLIIDGILQSSLTGIETNGTIAAQSRFIVGGSDYGKRNFEGYLHNVNLWDKVLSDEMLYMLTSQPGDDMGNVVAWKDFKKPAGILDEDFLIKQQNAEHFRVSTIFRDNVVLEFSEPFPAYGGSFHGWGCCWSRSGLTATMWLKLKKLPVTLFSLRNNKGIGPTVISLKILSDGKIIFFFKGENASLGSINVNVSAPFWNFVALSWSKGGGELHSNLNGVHKHITSNFFSDVWLRIGRKDTWVIGDRNNNSIVGHVIQFNIWLTPLSPPALMALSRGIYGGGCIGIPWGAIYQNPRGNVKVSQHESYYFPDFLVQKKRDQHCNDVLPATCVGKYRARLGVMENEGYKWGCFCEENLSADMNFNYGQGNYQERFNLLQIN